MARDNTGPVEGWQVEPKPWDADRCCPETCAGICESDSQAVWMHGVERVMLGELQIDPLGTE